MRKYLLVAVAALLFTVLANAQQSTVAPSALIVELARARELGRTEALQAISRVEEFTATNIKPGQNGLLVAQGDSWFDYPFYNVLTNLRWQYGYDIESTANNGKWLESMAHDADQLNALGELFKRVKSHGRKPRAILLSGGGNDIAGQQLTVLLNHRAVLDAPFNETPLDGLIVSEMFGRRLRNDMVSLISSVKTLSAKYFDDPEIPIFVHGYDHPVPDGRGYVGGFWFLPGPWLQPSFDIKGYSHNSDDVKRATDTMAALIDEYNKVLVSVANDSGLSHVFYIRVVGTLTNDIKTYQRDWGNELHPTRSGFQHVAAVFGDAIDTHSHN
jgi:lysophospholipase L1-like esterase